MRQVSSYQAKKVDVIIPTYNRTQLTYEAVESVLQQTYNNLNIIVIEDGSHKFRSIARKMLLNDNRIRYVALFKNRGVSYSRNLGVSLGNGEFIAFLDSDDLWHREKITEQLNFFDKNQEIHWVHCDETWNKKGRLIKQKKEHRKVAGIFTTRSFKRCLISPSSVVFRRSFWEQKKACFLNHFRIAEDYELWLRLNFENPIGFIQKPLVIKRAGRWPQLSQTAEIDRYRVLALHRFYQMYSKEPSFSKVADEWRTEIFHKIKILKKGAIKYNSKTRYKQYQNWEIFFKIDRTEAQL